MKFLKTVLSIALATIGLQARARLNKQAAQAFIQ